MVTNKGKQFMTKFLRSQWMESLKAKASGGLIDSRRI